MIHYNTTDTRAAQKYTLTRFDENVGYLTEEEARYSLAEFMRYNLGFTVELIFGFKIFPYQEYILQNWFENNFCMNVWARGGSKSWLVAVFVLLYAMFYEESKIVLASNVFRSSRRIASQCEKFLQASGGELIAQCYPSDLRRSTDLWELKANGGFIRALPLNEKIRGERSSLLIVDEFLLVPEGTYKNVLLPFLNSKNNIQEQLAIQEQEDELIKLGVLDEQGRTILEGNKKIIGLTSASYDFEYCYQIYSKWIKKAISPSSNLRDSKYFVSRLSYLALPPELIEENVVAEAKAGGENSPYFKREYMAIFAKGSDGFFSAKHISDSTIEDGQLPCIQIKGSPKSEYILAIDPSFSSSKTSDYFAMAVWEINKENKTITLAHSYGIPGGELKNHLGYFHYILMNFNIVLISADLHGGKGENFNFIETANQSQLFQNARINLKFFEGILDDCGENYIEEVALMRRTYNLTERAICYNQAFKGNWIRKANEFMQGRIQAKKVWFPSRLGVLDAEYAAACRFKPSHPLIGENGKELTTPELIEEQDVMIEETKKQIALIEPRVSAQGNMSFDLPATVKAIKGEDRARKDNYTTTLIACWAAKFYFDFLDDQLTADYEGWTPEFVA